MTLWLNLWGLLRTFWFTQLIKLVIHVARVPHIVQYTTQKHFWRKDTKITSPLFSDTQETAKDGCRKAGLPRWQRTASTPFGQVPHGPYWEPGDPSQATHGSRWDNGHVHTYRVIPLDSNDPPKNLSKNGNLIPPRMTNLRGVSTSIKDPPCTHPNTCEVT